MGVSEIAFLKKPHKWTEELLDNQKVTTWTTVALWKLPTGEQIQNGHRRVKVREI